MNSIMVDLKHFGSRSRWFSATGIFCAAALMAVASVGCERKEKVLDVETPAGDIEVYEDKTNDPGL